MKMRTENRALDKIYKRRDRYEIPDWQREEVWGPAKKQKLIDSVLQGWRLPKFYFLKVSENPEEYEVVDGQQRLRNTRDLMKALNDRRLEDLRRLVDEAVEGRVQFDAEFAKSVLREVFRNSERAKNLRHVVGYATLPIDLIPWVGAVAQKAVEEVVGFTIEKKYQQKHRWFYMLSNIAESSGVAG